MFSFNFARIREYVMRFIKPSLYMGGVDYFLNMWKTSDAKDRGILLLVFAPMFLCLAGLILSIVYFVLFVLPSYLFRVIGWGMLVALFGMGGKYFYSYFTGKSNNTTKQTSAEFIDVQFTESKRSNA